MSHPQSEGREQWMPDAQFHSSTVQDLSQGTVKSPNIIGNRTRNVKVLSIQKWQRGQQKDTEHRHPPHPDIQKHMFQKSKQGTGLPSSTLSPFFYLPNQETEDGAEMNDAEAAAALLSPPYTHTSGCSSCKLSTQPQPINIS